ncbi:TFIIS helical bundle-like domain containing protein [Novymonas esmeraldas]|uniref:TFIIS helical bundle-like domain containing protein n=1 Tax=Novymonas esmeraldas TaxID=1808958 RepID=A0AAW0EWI9_9TRYP
MEEEDSLLGLVASSLPVHAEGEEFELGGVGGSGTQADAGGGWSFEEALRTASGAAKDAAHEEDGEDSAEAGRSSAGEEEDEEEGEGDGGGASSGAADGVADVMDDAALLRISDKSAAKRLGKSLYRRWKKLRKSSSGGKSSKKKKDKHKSHKKDKDGAAAKARKEKTKKSKGDAARGSRRTARRGAEKSDDDDDDGDGDADVFLTTADGAAGVGGVNEEGLLPATNLSAEAAAIEARLHKATVREARMRMEKSAAAKPRKMTSAQLVAIAKELVAAMAKARRLDEDIVSGRNASADAFPLNRVALKAIVQARCRQVNMAGPLVEEGILQELSSWLFDIDRGEPAPYELRTIALDLLLALPMEGSIAASEDLTAFMGVSREHLIKTDLGRAINSLRRCHVETVENKAKCMQLLTAFSRVMSGATETDQADENKSRAVWRCQNDLTVASPFAVLQTRSEALQKSFMKPDPRDPTSYNGLLPWRPPPATITNVSGQLSNYIEKATIAPRHK